MVGVGIVGVGFALLRCLGFCGRIPELSVWGSWTWGVGVLVSWHEVWGRNSCTPGVQAMGTITVLTVK